MMGKKKAEPMEDEEINNTEVLSKGLRDKDGNPVYFGGLAPNGIISD
jgi:hypothetical protein